MRTLSTLVSLGLGLVRGTIVITLLGAPGCLINEDLYEERKAELANEDGDALRAEFDCDDHDPTVYQDAPELCDGKDNDCDGEVDDGLDPIVYYRDADGDGYGDTETTETRCDDLVPTGYVETPGDCDDSTPTISPRMDEDCDGIDNDCNGEIDDGLPDFEAGRDADEDGWGSTVDIVELGCDLWSVPEGYRVEVGDCDDSDATIHPDAPETCDGLDNNCDAVIDEGAGGVWYVDADGDGYGGAETAGGCEGGAGLSASSADCDDTDDAIHPAAEERCDTVDNDCDGTVDEGGNTYTYWPDTDGDGYGDTYTYPREGCEIPAGYVANDEDCDDSDADVNPGVDEVVAWLCYDGIDNNCDGAVDYGDEDGDGYEPIICSGGDCDDSDPDAHPYNAETCGDGVDNDCDTRVDETCP